MPYDVQRFIFSVSLCAMLAVNPVLATAPTNDEDLGTTHDVYVESTLNQATNGIAGVSYVNRMVNAAGNAAELAEGHAAAAGAHALSAAQSADEAHKVLADKVSIDQGANNKNKAMVTDDTGSVYAGYIAPSMIADGGTFEPSGPTLYSGFVLWSDFNGNVSWKIVDDKVLVPGSVTKHRIADGAVTLNKIAPPSSGSTSGVLFSDGGVPSWRKIGSFMLESGAVTADKISVDSGLSGTSVLMGGMSGNAHWGKVTANMIAADSGQSGVLFSDGGVPSWSKIESHMLQPGAVTIDKTAGVVGMVPVGSADATAYGQFWIE